LKRSLITAAAGLAFAAGLAAPAHAAAVAARHLQNVATPRLVSLRWEIIQRGLSDRASVSTRAGIDRLLAGRGVIPVGASFLTGANDLQEAA